PVVLRALLPDTFPDGGTIIDLRVDTRRILEARPDALVIVSRADAPLSGMDLTTAEKDRLVSY
ncbi:MAG: hypothetical protein HY829_00050, partial [Actinobacteria bacterium]|nr:hypothetical protein [Actinomycetota bacterium]